MKNLKELLSSSKQKSKHFSKGLTALLLAGTLTTQSCDNQDPIQEISTEQIDKNELAINQRLTRVEAGEGDNLTLNSNSIKIGEKTIASRLNPNYKVKVKEGDLEILNSNSNSQVTPEIGNHEYSITAQDNKTSQSFNVSVNVNDEQSAKLISDLEKLNDKTYPVDSKINLLDGINIPNNVKEITAYTEKDGTYTKINPSDFSINNTGPSSINLEIKKTSGNTSNIPLSLNICTKDYETIEFNDHLTMEEVMGKLDDGDPELYSRLEGLDLKIAEGKTASTMQEKYGAGKRSTEEFRQQFNIHNVILGERSSVHENFVDYILEKDGEPSNSNNSHAAKGISAMESMYNNPNNLQKYYSINSIIRHLYSIDFVKEIKEKYGVDCLITFSNSTGSMGTNKPNSNRDETMPIYNDDNVIGFTAIGNISNKYNMVVQYDKDLPEGNDKACYGPGSYANGDNGVHNNLTNHAVVGMNNKLDCHTSYNGSAFPYGFKENDVIGSWPAIYTSYSAGGKRVTDVGNCPSSFSTSTVRGVAQMYYSLTPGISAKELWERYKETGDLRNITYTDGTVCKVVVANPGKYFKKYCMPNIDNLPKTVEKDQIITLNRKDRFYNGVIFAGPGIEANVGGEWIEVNKENEDLIKNQAFNIKEYRFNATLAQKYTDSNSIDIKVVAVDDGSTNGKINNMTELNWNITLTEKSDTWIKPIYVQNQNEIKQSTSINLGNLLATNKKDNERQQANFIEKNAIITPKKDNFS